MYLQRFFLIFKEKIPFILGFSFTFALTGFFLKNELAIYLQFIGVLVLNENLLTEIKEKEEGFRSFIKQNGRNLKVYFVHFIIFTFILFFINYLILFIIKGFFASFSLLFACIFLLCIKFLNKVWQKLPFLLLIFGIFFINL